MVDPLNYESYWNMNPAQAAKGPDPGTSNLASRYELDLRDEGSFAAGVMRVPDQLVELGACAAAGNMTRAKELYDQINGFYANHTADLAQAATIDPKNNPLLSAVHRGALMGYDRAFDRVMVNTLQGQQSVGQLFGPDGTYQQASREAELKAQRFTSKTIDALNGADEELKATLNPLVDPLLGKARPGEKVGSRSQYVDLAHEVTSFWQQDVDDIGADGIREALSHITDKYLGDGSAITLYRSALDNARAQLDAGSETDAVQAVRKFFTTYDSLLTRTAGGSDGSTAPDSASRMLATLVSDVVAGQPDLDLDDPYVKHGLTEVMDLFARSDRAGINLLPIIQTSGGEFKKATVGYIQSRGQGLPPPEENLFVQVGRAGQRLQDMLTPGWFPVETTVRANPKEDVRTAAGVFGVQSTSPGLNYATVGLYKTLMEDQARRIARGASDVDAFWQMSSDPVLRASAARELQSDMLVSPQAASGIVQALFENLTREGVSRPMGLEQAVADFAFGGDQRDSLDVQDARQEARLWYAANLGPDSRGFDRMLASWDAVLDDDLVGFGVSAEGRARTAAMKQQARRKLYEAAQQGLPVQPLADAYKDYGQYYYVSGYRVAGTGEIVDGLPDKVRKALMSNDLKVIGKAMRDYAPVVDVAFGDLNEAEQPIEGWTPAGLGVIPSYGRRSWSNPVLRQGFRAAQEQLRNIYRKQQEAMAKELQKAAVADS